MSDNKKEDEPRPSVDIGGGANGNIFRNFTLIDVDTAVKIEGKAEDNVFENWTHIKSKPEQITPAKSWWERPTGIVFLAVVGGLLVAAIAYFAGWT